MSAGKKNANGRTRAGGGGCRRTAVTARRWPRTSVQVVEYAAAIDVAKGSGMVCTRVPGSRPDRRRQKVWRVEATYGEVIALMDHLRCEGIQRLVLESTSDYWRIWYYLAEAAGLEVWLVNARDVKHLPGRGKSDRLDCVWHCKLNERGMLRRSFVPPRAGPGPAGADPHPGPAGPGPGPAPGPGGEDPRGRAAEDLGGDLGPVRGQRPPVPGRPRRRGAQPQRRWPRSATTRLKATRRELEDALTGRFRDIHAFEIKTHLRLIDAINEEIARLDEAIGQQLALVPAHRAGLHRLRRGRRRPRPRLP